MKPIEYLCLAIFFAVMNLVHFNAILSVLMWVMFCAWVIASFRQFARDLEARKAAKALAAKYESASD